jgi:ribosomal protein L11 methyltransferase
VDAYLSLCCDLPNGVEEELPNLLQQSSILGTEIGCSDGEKTPVTIYFDRDQRETADVVAEILTEQGADRIRIQTRAGEDWLANYRESLQPFAVGSHWWIDPHPEIPSPVPPGRVPLTIEPRTAFGTGSHESTQLILTALEQMEVAGARVLDVGTGTGILALAADALGARSVVAFDIDPEAVWVARQTAGLQSWSPRVHYLVGPISCLEGADFDIVVCNMISKNFIPLLDDLGRLLAGGGRLVLSGLLQLETEAVSKVLAERGFELRSQGVLGEWTSVTAGRAEPS